MLMIRPEFYDKISELKQYSNFLECIQPVKEHQLEKEFHMELILRMMIGSQGDTDFGKFEPLSKAVIGDFIVSANLSPHTNKNEALS